MCRCCFVPIIINSVLSVFSLSLLDLIHNEMSVRLDIGLCVGPLLQKKVARRTVPKTITLSPLSMERVLERFRRRLCLRVFRAEHALLLKKNASTTAFLYTAGHLPTVNMGRPFYRWKLDATYQCPHEPLI